jgi:hypothetical protein
MSTPEQQRLDHLVSDRAEFWMACSLLTRSNMNRCTASEIKAAHLRRPAIGIPCPACDGIVDRSRPHEHEHYTRQHASALCNGADCESNSNASKHSLIHCKQEIRNLGTTYTRRAEDVSEADIVEVADEEVGVM